MEELNDIVYAVIKIDSGLRAELISLEKSQILAINKMTRCIDNNKKKFDKNVYIDFRRIEVYDKTVRIKKRGLRAAYVIQEHRLKKLLPLWREMTEKSERIISPNGREEIYADFHEKNQVEKSL